MIHDYIQWLFPIPERSAFNPFTPVLTSQDVEDIRQNSAAQENLKAAKGRMLNFYRRNTHWLTTVDHNHLRISRIIRSLSLVLGCEEAMSFYLQIKELVRSAGNPVSEQAQSYWRKASESEW